MASLPKLALKNVKYLLKQLIVMKPISLRRKKIRALRIFEHPIFKRKLPTPSIVREGLEFLTKNLKDYHNYLALTKTFQDAHFKSGVRLFEFKGHEFVVKDTWTSYLHGYATDPKSSMLRNFVKAHHNYFREQKLRTQVNYILRTPKLFGTIGTYLVMERIPHWTPKNTTERKALELGKKQLNRICKTVAENERILKPQTEDFIPVGMYKGKVVFCAVYDFA